jgi:hypothetical protein
MVHYHFCSQHDSLTNFSSLYVFSCNVRLLRQWFPRKKSNMGSKLARKIHKQNPNRKIVIDEILREFSPLHIFSCSAPRMKIYNIGFKISINKLRARPMSQNSDCWNIEGEIASQETIVPLLLENCWAHFTRSNGQGLERLGYSSIGIILASQIFLLHMKNN